jgi:sugar phosphate permease
MSLKLTRRQKISVRIAGALYLAYALLILAVARSWRAWVAAAGVFALIHAVAWYLELKETPRAEGD